MSFKFPYQYVFLGKKRVPYPMVTITLQTIQGAKDYLFVMDTGADMMVMPKYMMYLMDIDKSTLKKSYAHGITGKETKTFEAMIPITFCGESFSLRCAFTDNNKTPLLLGKEGIFDRFTLLFDNENGMTIFEKRK
jgi:hypothetical protein